MPRRTHTSTTFPVYAGPYTSPFAALASGASAGWQGAKTKQETLEADARTVAAKQALGVYQADRRYDASAYGTDARTTETRDKSVSAYVGSVYNDLQKGVLTPAGFQAKIAAGSGVFGYDASLYPLPAGVSAAAPQIPSTQLQTPGFSPPSGLPRAPAVGLNFGMAAAPRAASPATGGTPVLFPDAPGLRESGPTSVRPVGGSQAPLPLALPPAIDTSGLGPGAASVINNRNAATTQHGQRLASEFTAKLPKALADIGNLPAASQPAAVQALITQGQALGADVSQIRMPGQPVMGPDGQPETRPRNYGLTSPRQIAALAELRQMLDRGNAPTDSVNFGGRSYSRGQFAQAFPSDPVPVLTPFYGNSQTAASQIGANNARATATTAGVGERKRHNVATEGETHAYHQGTLTETTRNHTLAHTDRVAGQGIAHQDRQSGQYLTLYGKMAGSAGGRSSDPLGAVDREIAAYSKPGKATYDANFNPVPGKALKDASPEGAQYFKHLQNRRRQILNAQSAGPVVPGLTPGYATVPGIGKVPVPRGLGPLPGFGSPVAQSAPARAPKPSAAPRSRYRGMTDAQIIAEYKRQQKAAGH